jgi:hypothetical protein
VWPPLLAFGGAGVVVCLVVVGVVWWTRGGGPSPHGNSAFRSARPAESATASPSPTCAAPDGWSCVQHNRFEAVQRYMDGKKAANGYLSVVFTDRKTGATWRYGPTDHPGWTASTIKLAMATDILRRARAGEITLSDQDRTDMANMLNYSDESASDRLWDRYGGDDQLARFRDVFGMTNLNFVPGFTTSTYWGFVKCTSEDLSHLVHYVLTETDPDDRQYLVTAMRGVAENQQWGVWAAGPDEQPGNKDGWSYEEDSYGHHWVLNTVGFAGPDERYTVAVMFQVQPGESEAYGAHAVSDVVSLLFGRPAGSTTLVPKPDG